MPAYLDNLRDLGYLVAEPKAGPLFTVEDDGTLIMEWLAPRLAVRITADTADGLAARVAATRSGRRSPRPGRRRSTPCAPWWSCSRRGRRAGGKGRASSCQPLH